MLRSEASVGQEVYFGRANGEKSLGRIAKVNKKNLKVELLEARGVYRDYKVGGFWTVPPSLCSPASEGRPNQVTRRRRAPRRSYRY